MFIWGRGIFVSLLLTTLVAPYVTGSGQARTPSNGPPKSTAPKTAGRGKPTPANEKAKVATNKPDLHPSDTGKNNKECSSSGKECSQDANGKDAMKQLHLLIDDDMNGNVDQTESDEFLRDELQYKDGNERHKMFHGKDKLISSDDLWQAWQESEVYNWTVQDVGDWLVTYADLPQYVELFKEKGINGTMLPRIAANNHHYLSGGLGIKNAVDKQKLSLKAMDVVLFGAPKKGLSFVKDLAVVTLLVVAIGGCWFAYVQHGNSQSHLKKMLKDLDQLQLAENSLGQLQAELEKAQKDQRLVVEEKQSLEERYKDEINTAKKEAGRLREAREVDGTLDISRLKLAEEELIQVRTALRQSEKELEMRPVYIPEELQSFLQLSHEVEVQYYNIKKKAAESQLSSARDACEKLRKKRTSFMGSLKIAHSNSIDDIDQRIMHARCALEEVQYNLKERTTRWSRIEDLCGFSVIVNLGLVPLTQILYQDPGLQLGRNALTSLIAPIPVDDADEDMPPSYPTATAALFYSGALHNGPSWCPSYAGPQSGGKHPSYRDVRLQNLNKTPVSSICGQRQTSPTRSEGSDTTPGSGSSTSNGVRFHLGPEQSAHSPETNDSGSLGTDSEQHHMTYHKAASQVFPKSISQHHAASLQDWNVRSRASSLNTSTSVPSLTSLTKRTSSDPNFRSTNKVKMTHSKSAPNDAIEAETSGTESTDSLDDKKRDKKKKKKKLLPSFLRKDSDLPKVS